MEMVFFQDTPDHMVSLVEHFSELKNSMALASITIAMEIRPRPQRASNAFAVSVIWKDVTL